MLHLPTWHISYLLLVFSVHAEVQALWKYMFAAKVIF